MSNNDFIIEAVKGKPNSLTSIAFNTGVTLERSRIIKLIDEAHQDELYREGIIALIKGEGENK